MGARSSQPDAPVLLFVEDDYNWTYLFRIEFEKLAPHWEIVCLPGGLAATLQLENKTTPQVLVTDLNMPGMSGLDLIEWIKGRPQFRHLPIIVLSNSEDPSQRERCVALGVRSFLDKPGSLKALRNNIHHIVKLCDETRLHSQDGKEMTCV